MSGSSDPQDLRIHFCGNIHALSEGIGSENWLHIWKMVHDKDFLFEQLPWRLLIIHSNLGVGWELYTPHFTFAGIPPALQPKDLCSYCQQISIWSNFVISFKHLLWTPFWQYQPLSWPKKKILYRCLEGYCCKQNLLEVGTQKYAGSGVWATML